MVSSIPRMTLRLLPVALALLLGLSFALPAATAASPDGCRSTPAGWSVCVRTGDCKSAALVPPFTDFYPSAGACRVAPSNGALVCERAYAGYLGIGGFADAMACLGGEGLLVGCADLRHPDVILPICL